ncbi:UNVERIFIED_CONTAM: Retrovirus-related Pol polyprotein from transposon TNT 1-94, partial [Sesamum latifolium]
MISNSATWVLDTGCGAHIYNDLQVLERNRRLSKDEMILRLGDGKAVASEAVGSLRLVARLGHISKDRISRLVDSKNLEIDNLDHLPTCESCLKGKMTKKPFVGQRAIANGLLDLVHTNVCGSLSIPTRGEFSYFITFIDDHSRYGYVYLMRYKSEAFGRFKEYKLEVENQTNRKIKAFGRTEVEEPNLVGHGSIHDEFYETPPVLLGYALDTAAKLLNIAPSKSVPQMPYEIWHGKPASYKYLRVWGSPAYVKRLVGDKLDLRSSLCRFIGYMKETAGYYFYDPAKQKIFVSRNAVFLEKDFPSDNRRDEVLIEESSGEPHHDRTTSFEPTVHTDGVPILRRSTRESRIPERYGFMGLTSQLDNDPKTYGEAMSNIDSDKWLEAMKSENGLDGFKPSLDPRRPTQGRKARGERIYSTIWVDFEETYSPVAMIKSIRILLAIAAWYDYEIWQMEVKTAFLNCFVEEEIFMDQLEGFTAVGEEQK